MARTKTKEPKQHEDRYGTYIWEKYPSKFYLNLPWLHRLEYEDCGHKYFKLGTKGFFPRKWAKEKVYLKENLLAYITDIKPQKTVLFDTLFKEKDKWS